MPNLLDEDEEYKLGVPKDTDVLIDFGNLSMRNLFVEFDPLDTEFTAWKYKVLQSLKHIRNMHEAEEYIVCIDSRNNWRKEIYPEYKSHRAALRDKSKVDFEKFFKVEAEYLKSLKETIKRFVWMKVERAEADDIIYCISKKNSRCGRKTIIVSTDKDFVQLLTFPGVSIYNPIKKSFIEGVNAKEELLIKCIIGDKSDNIPPIHFKCGPVKALKYIADMNQIFENKEYKERYEQNCKLIDMQFIPDDIIYKIETEYDAYDKSTYSDYNKVMNFFISNAPNLLGEIQNFL